MLKPLALVLPLGLDSFAVAIGATLITATELWPSSLEMVTTSAPAPQLVSERVAQLVRQRDHSQ